MRFIASLILVLLFTFKVSATNWYLAREATGLNDGTSWTNGWTSVSNVTWGTIIAGDTLWISGGPTGGTNTYLGSLASSSQNSGSLGNPITMRVGNDSAHNGLAKFIGGIVLSRDYWTLDGSLSAWTPGQVSDTYNVGTNCNIEVYQTNLTSAVAAFGTGSKVKWIHISQMTSRDDNAISMVDNGPGHLIGNGSELAYNWISEANGYGIRCEIAANVTNTYIGAGVVSNTYGQIAIHHNLIEHTHDNFLQVSAWADIYKNVGRYQEYPVAGHPDVIQEVQAFCRIWDNIFYENQGTGFYVELNTVLTHDLLCYNNIWWSQTNSMLNLFDLTAHDNEVGQDAGISNVWIFNNTVANVGQGDTPAAFSWNGGSTAVARGLKSVTNLWFANNAIVGLAPFNTKVMLQFVTNQSVFNGYVGFLYKPSDCVVDYNCVMGSGNGRGIAYGNGGSAAMTNFYPTMSAFAAAYPQYFHNNNLTASFISVSNRDFRIAAGDTALTGNGTNMAGMLVALAPDATNDIAGNPRGTTPSIGAYDVPPSTNALWVSITGNDANPGTFTSPFRTIQHGHDAAPDGYTVFVTPGDYNEYVDSGTTAKHVRICGYPANDQSNPVLLRSFRSKHQFITLEGLTLSKAVGANQAMIRIEPPSSGGNNGSDCVITNCTIKDSVHLISSTVSFGSNFVHIRNATEGTDFNTAGFTTGVTVGFGADSLNIYTNHNQFLPWASNSADGLTMYFTTNLLSDSGTNYWAAFVTGQANNASSYGITSPKSSSPFPSASNVVIANCTFSNLLAISIDLADGISNYVHHNTFIHNHGEDALRFYTPNSEYSYNLFLENTNILFFTPGELSNTNLHPPGGTYYDWQTTLITMGNPGISNVYYHHNWVQENDGAGQTFDWATNCYNWRLSYNVWIGVTKEISVNGSGITVDHNTYWRTPFEDSVAPLLAGSHISQDLVITSNAFVNVGGHVNPSQEFPYGINPTGNYTNLSVSNNIAVTFETGNWSNSVLALFTNWNGVVTTGVLTNTFDPLFVNPMNPLGPDGIPFTADDGLRPMPNSALATNGIGAEPAIPLSGLPIAHFKITLATPGWKDLTGTNFNLAWCLLKPDQRGGVIRPWAIPEAIGTNGELSVTATIDASASQDGQTGGASGITNYTFTFSDGAMVSGPSATTSHTFTTGGTNLVTLTTTAFGLTSTYSNAYRLNAPIAPPPGNGSIMRVTNLKVGNTRIGP